ncbi:MAG: LuxR C-terminal-related transcriptional regulator [Paracoccus sp. (in: a-proteobacteria)]
MLHQHNKMPACPAIASLELRDADGTSRSALVQPHVAVIDPRPLPLECFVRCLEAYRAGTVIESYPSMDAWRDAHRDDDFQIVLYNLAVYSLSGNQADTDVPGIVKAAGKSRLIILSDSTDLETMLAAISSGAAGFVPPDAKLSDVVEAIRIAHSGGTYLPRTSLLMLSKALAANQHHKDETEAEDQFTHRQMAVARALQRGAANKTIAYELNLCESTVKVHIRTIMRKVKATNRTQAALRLDSLIGKADGHSR